MLVDGSVVLDAPIAIECSVAAAGGTSVTVSPVLAHLSAVQTWAMLDAYSAIGCTQFLGPRPSFSTGAAATLAEDAAVPGCAVRIVGLKIGPASFHLDTFVVDVDGARDPLARVEAIAVAGATVRVPHPIQVHVDAVALAFLEHALGDHGSVGGPASDDESLSASDAGSNEALAGEPSSPNVVSVAGAGGKLSSDLQSGWRPGGCWYWARES